MARASDRPPGTRRRPHKLGDYSVGYGRAPVEHRFKKGEVNNSLGRKKKDRKITQVNVADLLLEPTPIRNGKARPEKMPFLAGLVQTLKVKAAAGNLRAADMLLKLGIDFGLLTVNMLGGDNRPNIIVTVVRPDGTRKRIGGNDGPSSGQ